MSTTPIPTPPVPPSPPTIPLTPAARAAYKALNDKNEQAIQSTRDVGVLEALNAAQLDVRNILTKDNMYRLHASTALYNALLEQINDTNKSLKKLQEQIAAVDKDFDYASEVIDAIGTVLKVVPIP